MSIIIFDIDDFKEVNDNHGHLAGDYVLKEMAHVVKHQAIRSNDYFARYGGEEFVLILSNSSLDEGVTVAERIRSIIEKHDFYFEGKRLPITVSAGVACRDLETKGWEELFQKADQACYESKRDGRNRVTAL
jgi:diguanylate cyclase (GGDEF)-like protein